MTTGQYIKSARQKAGMTQAQLAEKLGIPYQSIGQWERDIRNPKLDTLKRIAHALNITIQELMDLPRWMDEDHIIELPDVPDQGRKLSDEIQGWLDLLKEFRATSPLLTDVNFYEKIRAYVLDAIDSFTPEGLLRLVETIDKMKKVPDYQLPARSNEYE